MFAPSSKTMLLFVLGALALLHVSAAGYIRPPPGARVNRAGQMTNAERIARNLPLNPPKRRSTKTGALRPRQSPNAAPFNAYMEVRDADGNVLGGVYIDSNGLAKVGSDPGDQIYAASGSGSQGQLKDTSITNNQYLGMSVPQDGSTSPANGIYEFVSAEGDNASPNANPQSYTWDWSGPTSQLTWTVYNSDETTTTSGDRYVWDITTNLLYIGDNTKLPSGDALEIVWIYFVQSVN